MIDVDTPLGRLRVAAGLSRLEAARRLGVDQSALFRWEKGDRDPGARQVRALARLYDVPAEKVLDAIEAGQVDEPPTPGDKP